MCSMSQAGHMIPSYSSTSWYQVAFHLGWKIQGVFSNNFSFPLKLLQRWFIHYQQENIWLRRNVLVSRGSSDFFTLLFKAWRKHCNSMASITSVKTRHDLYYILFSEHAKKKKVFHSWINITKPHVHKKNPTKSSSLPCNHLVVITSIRFKSGIKVFMRFWRSIIKSRFRTTLVGSNLMVNL